MLSQKILAQNMVIVPLTCTVLVEWLKKKKKGKAGKAECDFCIPALTSGVYWNNLSVFCGWTVTQTHSKCFRDSSFVGNSQWDFEYSSIMYKQLFERERQQQHQQNLSILTKSHCKLWLLFFFLFFSSSQKSWVKTHADLYIDTSNSFSC